MKAAGVVWTSLTLTLTGNELSGSGSRQFTTDDRTFGTNRLGGGVSHNQYRRDDKDRTLLVLLCELLSDT